ncbi:MAG TPA: hypothetical protein DEQ51_07975 [Alphaproteobacteria bacterium]|nr:hypothetical protein [Alphaproteobacteria bacterium]
MDWSENRLSVICWRILLVLLALRSAVVYAPFLAKINEHAIIIIPASFCPLYQNNSIYQLVAAGLQEKIE